MPVYYHHYIFLLDVCLKRREWKLSLHWFILDNCLYYSNYSIGLYTYTLAYILFITFISNKCIYDNCILFRSQCGFDKWPKHSVKSPLFVKNPSMTHKKMFLKINRNNYNVLNNKSNLIYVFIMIHKNVELFVQKLWHN